MYLFVSFVAFISFLVWRAFFFCRYYLANFLKSYLGLLFYLVAAVVDVVVVVDGMNNAYLGKKVNMCNVKRLFVFYSY